MRFNKLFTILTQTHTYTDEQLPSAKYILLSKVFMALHKFIPACPYRPLTCLSYTPLWTPVTSYTQLSMLPVPGCTSHKHGARTQQTPSRCQLPFFLKHCLWSHCPRAWSTLHSSPSLAACLRCHGHCAAAPRAAGCHLYPPTELFWLQIHFHYCMTM